MERVVRVLDSFQAVDQADDLFRAGLTPKRRVEIFFQIRESRDLREVCRVLELEQTSTRAEYLVVGALAVSWHGFPRYSGDVGFSFALRPKTHTGCGPHLSNSDLVYSTSRLRISLFPAR